MRSHRINFSVAAGATIGPVTDARTIWTAAVLLGCLAQSLPAQIPARSADLGFPIGIAAHPDGSLLISERRTHRIQRLNLTTGTLTRFAGTGVAGFSGDGGRAELAQLNCPDAVDVDRAGNVNVADRCNERIRRIDAVSGRISTAAGTGRRGPGPDGPALEVDLTGVFYLRVDSDGRILFADTDANRVRELDLGRGWITTLGGNGDPGFGGDGGPALSASLSRPHVVLRLRNGDLVIGDSFNHRLRLVDATSGRMLTIAGNGEERAAVAGAPALESPLLYFGEIHELAGGSLVWTEWGSSQLVRLDRDQGRLEIVAGSTAFGRVDADGPLASNPAIGSGVDFVIDGRGRYIIAIAGSGLVRRVDPVAMTVETLAGRPRS
jgi:hypothetical protein